MIWVLLTVLAILVPGLSLAEQPYIEIPVMSPQEEHQLLMEIGRSVEESRAEAARELEAEEERQAEQAQAEAVEEDRGEPAGDPSPPAPPGRTVWDDLADCESGNWVNGGSSFEVGSARWHMGGTDSRAEAQPAWGNGLFYGGVQFTLESWEWAAQIGGHDVAPNPANNSREQQIAVAETLLDLQGWRAWPTCSKKLGLR